MAQVTTIDINNYDTNIAELRDIITSFQKGNMPLGQAVDKYKRSDTLINACKKALSDFDQMKAIPTEISVSNTSKSFEEKLQRLEQMSFMIDSNQNIPLELLSQLLSESKSLIDQCKFELDNFKHIVEYQSNSDKHI